MSWEPVRTPDRYLEPPEPKPWTCSVCERDEDYCDCKSCDSCDAIGATKKCTSGDEVLWLCSDCELEDDE